MNLRPKFKRFVDTPKVECRLSFSSYKKIISREENKTRIFHEFSEPSSRKNIGKMYFIKKTKSEKREKSKWDNCGRNKLNPDMLYLKHKRDPYVMRTVICKENKGWPRLVHIHLA
ncbi:hypothetical protein OAG24_01180 [bacterium]|nr:hypothetical protein [bacterium]